VKWRCSANCWTGCTLLDLFQGVQRHVLTLPSGRQQVLLTRLSPLQRQILKLLRLSHATYGR
jgi:hypothetical protein